MNIANCRLSLFVNSKDAHIHTYSCYYSKDKLELQTLYNESLIDVSV